MNLGETVQSVIYFLVIVNNVAMNVDVQIAVKSPCFQYFGDVCPEVGWLAHTVFLFVESPVFRGTCLWNHHSVCCGRQMVQLGGRSVVVLVAQSCPTLRPHRLWPTRLLCPWDYPGKNTGVDCHSLLQRIFPTQGFNLGPLHCRQILYRLSYREGKIS